MKIIISISISFFYLCCMASHWKYQKAVMYSKATDTSFTKITGTSYVLDSLLYDTNGNILRDITFLVYNDTKGNDSFALYILDSSGYDYKNRLTYKLNYTPLKTQLQKSNDKHWYYTDSPYKEIIYSTSNNYPLDSIVKILNKDYKDSIYIRYTFYSGYNVIIYKYYYYTNSGTLDSVFSTSYDGKVKKWSPYGYLYKYKYTQDTELVTNYTYTNKVLTDSASFINIYNIEGKWIYNAAVMDKTKPNIISTQTWTYNKSSQLTNYNYFNYDSGKKKIVLWYQRDMYGYTTEGYPYYIKKHIYPAGSGGFDIASLKTYKYISTFTSIQNINMPTPPLTLYPNPAHSQIFINTNQELKNTTLIITDITGKEVYRQANFNAAAPVSTEALAKGFYLLSLSSEEGRWMGKFVKE